MINGVTFNKKLRGEIQEKFFEDWKKAPD
jgi:hypothetical protein